MSLSLQNTRLRVPDTMQTCTHTHIHARMQKGIHFKVNVNVSNQTHVDASRQIHSGNRNTHMQ